MKNYGKELILDIHDCNTSDFNRKGLTKFFESLCDFIDMERCLLTFWDYEGELEEYAKAPAHLKGTTAVQFISTSNVTIHTLDEMKRVYLNIFSCKDFEPDAVVGFCVAWFNGTLVNKQEVDRI